MNGALKTSVEQLHHCKATWLESVPVKETFHGQTVWEGIVEVFELIDHPTAKKCYAWSHSVDESGKRKFIAVLQEGPVDSPEKAVKVFIVSKFKNSNID
jgi:hypothetical protein